MDSSGHKRVLLKRVVLKQMTDQKPSFHLCFELKDPDQKKETELEQNMDQKRVSSISYWNTSNQYFELQ